MGMGKAMPHCNATTQRSGQEKEFAPAVPNYPV